MLRRRIIYLLIPLLLLATATASSSASGPQRIVSCGPAVTEKLYLLGAGSRVVGVTAFCRRPAEASRCAKIGNVTQVNVEKVLMLKPDLVIATSLTDPRAVRKLTDLGVKVVLFGEPKSFGAMNEQFIELGRLTGKEGEARKIVRVAEEEVASTRRRTEGLRKPRVFLEIGTAPLFAATGESFLNDYIEFAGAINVARDLKGGFTSREQVLRYNPDVILITAMEGAGAENEKRRWQKIATLKAAKGGAIHIIEPYKMCSPTPITFVEALAEVERLIHGHRDRGAKP